MECTSSVTLSPAGVGKPMDFARSPLAALCNMFPQVDVRIIKGAVLEHKNDIEAAIDFITHDILAVDNELNMILGTANEVGVAENLPQSIVEEIDHIDPSRTSSLATERETDVQKFETWLKEDLDLHQWDFQHPFITSEEGFEVHSSSQLKSETLADLPLVEQDCTTSGFSSFSNIKGSSNQSEIEGKNEFKNIGDMDVLKKSSECIERPYQETDACSFSMVDFPLNTGCDNVATWVTISSSSQYNVSIESLDEVVKEARGDKDYLVKEIQGINALWSKVEKEEAVAKKVKADVLMAGQDDLKKAEELRETAARVRAANEMHAGEIFGERAVLSTEARELRLRLVQLKEQKLKALTLLNDVQSVLQLRYESAIKDRKDAEEEKQRIESDAKRVLAAEEEEMSKVEQKSRELNTETEECIRLRDYLVEQGNFVDSLQGEVSVLCEDVETVKRKIEDGALRNDFSFITSRILNIEGSHCCVEAEASILSSNQKLLSDTIECCPVLENSDCVVLKRNIENGDLRSELSCMTDYSQDTEELGSFMECKPSILTSNQKLSLSDSLDVYHVVENNNIFADSGSLSSDLPTSSNFDGLDGNKLLESTGFISSHSSKGINSASIRMDYLCYGSDAGFTSSNRGREQADSQPQESGLGDQNFHWIGRHLQKHKVCDSGDDSWYMPDIPHGFNV